MSFPRPSQRETTRDVQSRNPLRRWALAVAGIWLMTSLGFSAPALEPLTLSTQEIADESDDDARITGFSIPNTRSAHAISERALSHIQAKRWNEAIEGLQLLLENHRAELILDSKSGHRGTPVHRGAGGWAARELLALPEEARGLYQTRFGKRARAALDLARERGDRQSVIELAERWPATEEAVLAWWTLGDLELELGNLEQARAAWGRALARRLQGCVGGELFDFRANTIYEWENAQKLIQESGCQLAAGETRRCEFALSTLADDNPLAEAARASSSPQGSLRLPGPGEGAKGTPGPDASTWPRPFKIPSPHPFEPGNSGNLFPVRVGDVVLLSSSMRLFAINAYSGALRWASDWPAGWDDLTENDKRDFFAGIAPHDTMIAPAASERIVVSAHQVPVTDLENASFRNIAITTIIPDRRLYAYDVETGKELWNHHPPERWDGESGNFTDRMSVAGPPVISASRVIVPVHRMYGRIEFYVACYDLVSGEVLWTTQLVSGQRELNMFARAEREFSAPPVRIEDDRVVVLTQLGAVAVLDLFSGSIVWETLYDQIVPPARSSFSAQRIKNYWRNAPPVVADGVIVVTPFDSRNLVGFDFETGDKLWHVEYSRIDQLAGPYRDDVNLLIGADEHTVYLGGWPVMALRSSGGLHREKPYELAWRYPAGEIESDNSTSARALLLSDRIIIPTRNERIEVDRFGGGRRHKSVPWKSGRSGNMLVEDGTLYTLTTGHLDGYFEWDMLLDRGRRAYEESEGDRDSSLYLASLLSERSRTELEAGRTALARDWLVEAEALLEPLLARDEVDPAVAAEMHSLLRTRGQVFIDLADGHEAIKALQRARDWAPTVGSLRDTLIEEYGFHYGGDESAVTEILDTLSARCGAFKMSARVELDERLPYGWRFEAIVHPKEPTFGIWELSISMWTTLERANRAAEAGRVAEEFEHLHQLLEYWPDRTIPAIRAQERNLAEFATRRIGELIERNGRSSYAPFEAKAGELLEEARRTLDRELLSMVNELYPWSAAAREANDQLLSWASESGDVEAVAEIALSEIPTSWNPRSADERELQLLLHLGAALERSGNLDYPRALYRSLAEQAPALKSASPGHGERTLAELARASEDAAIDLAARQGEAGLPRFTHDFLSIFRAEGRHTFLGEIPPRAGELEFADPVLLFARDEGERRREISLVAYAAESLAFGEPAPLWTVRLSNRELPTTWRNTIAFSPGKVLAATPDGVYALDRDDGTRAWPREWFAPDGNVISIQSGTGLVTVSVSTPETLDAVYALDWSNGQEVWKAEFDSNRQDRDLLLGGDCIVLMPRRSQQTGFVLDHFSGRPITEFVLPTGIHQSSHDAAWIENGLLLVPWFLNGRNQVQNQICAIDLMSGQVAWTVNFSEVVGGRRELRSIVQHGGKTYLLLRPAMDASQEGVRSIFVELRIGRRMGAVARVGSFEQEDDHRLIGIHQERRVELEDPFVYLFSFGEGEADMRIQSLHLPYGTLRWTHDLPITRDQLHNRMMHLPAQSAESVAFVISEKGERRLITPLTTLHVLDKATGRGQARMRLDSKLGDSGDVRLLGLGRALIMAGEDMLEVLR